MGRAPGLRVAGRLLCLALLAGVPSFVGQTGPVTGYRVQGPELPRLRPALAAKKKKVDPERAAKRAAAAQARALAVAKAKEEKAKLESDDDAAGEPLAAAPASPASPAPVAAAAAPVKVSPKPSAKPKPRQVTTPRAAKRQEREEALRRAAEVRAKQAAAAAPPKSAAPKSAAPKRARPAKPAEPAKRIESDVTQLSVAELKAELRKRELKVSGKKQDLILRLQAAQGGEGEEPGPEPEPEPETKEYAKMKVAELREELRARGLVVSGRKAELVQRLEAASETDTTASDAGPRVGQKLRGRVSSLHNLGAFVDIGLHRNALVRLPRLAERHVESAEEVVQVGEEVDVWVYRINSKGQLGLSLIEFPSSSLQDPVAAFQGRTRTERYQGKVRYEGKEVYFVDVAVPEGGGFAQGTLEKSEVNGNVSPGMELEVRVKKISAQAGLLHLAA